MSSTKDWVERARSLVAPLAEASRSIDAERELPPSVLAAMHEAKLFRITLPRSLGGSELPLSGIAQVTEILASADASAAWCLGQAAGCAMSAAFLDAPQARQVFGPADAVLAWGAGPQGRALAVDGGYRVSGAWGFASGGKHASWLGGHCFVYEPDGTQRTGPNGTPLQRTALFPRDAASIADDWYVMGLRGTRSEGYAVEDLFVEDAMTIDRDDPGECRIDATLYRFNTTNVYASAFSGVALGIARASLDDLLALARHKHARGAGTSMRDSAVVQTRLAELEAKLGAARAYQQQVLADVWRSVETSAELTLESRVIMRLATTHAINEATDVVEQVYRLAGATAIFDSQPFEQRFRDAHAVSQQVQGRHTNYETVGRFMLGHEVDTLFL
ncbi:MAG: acyl-CoA dehydrogenase family protein [Gammaproteobacteria bacterium]|nr:acyl-CoA dehydrogenase family protein [Gammaproteobacteria bacterium]